MQRHISMEQIDCLQFEVNNLKPVEVSSNTKNMYTYIIYIYILFLLITMLEWKRNPALSKVI